MTITMEEVYGVTSFLDKDNYVDREYPFNFNQNSENNPLENIKPTEKVELSKDEAYIHENSLLFKNLNNEENIIIQCPVRKFDKSNIFEIKVKSDIELDPNLITIGFSESQNGKPYVIELKPDQKEKLTEDIENIISFTIISPNDPNSKTDFLSNIRSISINFNQNINQIYLMDVLFKNYFSPFTIEDVDKQLKEAENYILKKISRDSIPTELKYLKPKAAAAFLSRILWQNEGGFDNGNSSKPKRYSQELLSEIKEDITTFLEENENIGDEEEINMNLVGWG